MAGPKEDYQEDTDDGRGEAENNGHFECKKCGQKFTLSSNYRRHILHNKICGSKKEGFKCSNCHKQFSLGATLKDHYDRCTAEDPYRFNCPNCPKLFTFKSSLNKHLRGRCRNIKKNDAMKTYKCIYCAVELLSYSAWRKHLDEALCTKEQQRIHICPHCANRFTLKTSLNKHLKGRCKAMKKYTIDGEYPKYETAADISPENEDESVTSYEVITCDDVIEESPEWETFETKDVESYIEISNESADGNNFEFSIHKRKQL